jgi:hypothetical protein
MRAAVVVVVALAATLVYGAATGWLGLSLKREIEILDVASLAVGVLIALVLQYYVAEKATDVRAEKDLLVDNARECLRQVRECRDAVTSVYGASAISTQAKSEILLAFRRAANELEQLTIGIRASRLKGLGEDCEHTRLDLTAYKMPQPVAIFRRSLTLHRCWHRKVRFSIH